MRGVCRPNGARFCCGAPLDSNTDRLDLTAPSQQALVRSLPV